VFQFVNCSFFLNFKNTLSQKGSLRSVILPFCSHIFCSIFYSHIFSFLSFFSCCFTNPNHPSPPHTWQRLPHLKNSTMSLPRPMANLFSSTFSQPVCSLIKHLSYTDHSLIIHLSFTDHTLIIHCVCCRVSTVPCDRALCAHAERVVRWTGHGRQGRRRPAPGHRTGLQHHSNAHIRLHQGLKGSKEN